MFYHLSEPFLIIRHGVVWCATKPIVSLFVGPFFRQLSEWRSLEERRRNMFWEPDTLITLQSWATSTTPPRALQTQRRSSTLTQGLRGTDKPTARRRSPPLAGPGGLVRCWMRTENQFTTTTTLLTNTTLPHTNTIWRRQLVDLRGSGGVLRRGRDRPKARATARDRSRARRSRTWNPSPHRTPALASPATGAWATRTPDWELTDRGSPAARLAALRRHCSNTPTPHNQTSAKARQVRLSVRHNNTPARTGHKEGSVRIRWASLGSFQHRLNLTSPPGITPSPTNAPILRW